MVTNNATPPAGHDWGERTRQAVAHSAPKHWKTDAYEMRQKFGIPSFKPDDYVPEPGQVKSDVYPDLVVHERDPTVTTTPRGTDAFIKGDRGSGKSTKAASLAIRLLEDFPFVDEMNANKVIWRGSPARSEWLRLKDWATVWLPEHASIEATWEDEDAGRYDADIEAVARDVRYYHDVLDLVDQLAEQKPGTFNVVYPDPSFSGCRELTEETQRVGEPLPFVPTWEADPSEGRHATPLTDWWFAFILARTEHGTHVGWTALIFDEVGDFVPQSARNSPGRRLWDKIELLRSLWAESRRARFSQFYFGHYEENVHEKIRREFKWRIQMPDGSPNPVKNVRGTWPLGFDNIPMTSDLTSGLPIGTGLCYNTAKFSYFGWKDVAEAPEDETRWLRVRLGAPTQLPSTAMATEADAPAEPEFDDSVFASWQNQVDHRLYVRDPGSGWISVATGAVGDELVSPVEGMTFDEPVVEDGEVVVRMRRNADESVVVARLPSTSQSFKSASGSGGETA
ncbi:hypothetical protein NKF06_12755 [Haloferax sp. AB510]|uniref:hypothetical protein n=1 Tax=Haloferax sp. AB510 TaxID=2934172 RepID=UPI00209C173F|nr:hypothetical protein [Haloferax sp. AB510]MCO8267433.1 hypothetical protein [Haloferax sp. AB510]